MRAVPLLLAIAACGKVGTLADAPSLVDDDLGPDASQDVTVTVLDPQSGAPVSGVPVVFTDAGGATLGHPTTGTGGQATQAMPGGGSITAVLPDGANGYEMQTVLDVKAGDAITLDVPPTDSTTATYTLTLSPDGGASYYYVYGPCGRQYTQTTSTTLTLDAHCEIPAMDLIAIAYDANDEPLGYIERSAIAFTPGGSTTVSATWQPLTTFTATATNLPSDVTAVDVQRYWPDGYGYGIGNSATITGASASASLSGPTSLMAVVETGLTNGAGSIQRIRQRNPGTWTAYNLDVGSSLLAWVGAPTLDPALGTITTPVSGISNGVPDIFSVSVSYDRTVTGTSTSYTWIVYAPDVGDITLPTLPPEVGDVGPKAGDTVGSGGHAELADYDSISGYDVARLNPTAAIGEYFIDRGRGPTIARYSQSPLVE